MKEYKSKKTGRISIYSDEEHKEMAEKGVINLKNFDIRDIRPIRSKIPTELITKKTKK